VPFDSLWKRERRRRQQRLVTTGSALVASIVAVLVPTLVLCDLHDRQQSVAELIVETQNATANGQYELAMQTALEGLPVKRDIPWALGWSDEGIKSLAADFAGAAELAPLVGGSKDSDNITSVAYSPDGSRILTPSERGTATMWDVKSLQPIARCDGEKIIDSRLLKTGSVPNRPAAGRRWTANST
jgi:hypothetical protein